MMTDFFKDEQIEAYTAIPHFFCPQASDNLIVFRADNGNHFTHYGIFEGMYLVFDMEKDFKRGHLSCYHNKKSNNKPPFRVSDKPLRGYEHFARLVMTIRNCEVEYGTN